MSNKPRSATPNTGFDEIRRTFVADSPNHLPKNTLLRTTLRVQGALWTAALDPKSSPRLHLLRRQSLWTIDDVPARHRANLLSLTAAEAAIQRGLDRWSLDLADLTLSEGGLADLFRHRRSPPVLLPDHLPTAGLLRSASSSPPNARACAAATSASPSATSSKKASP